MMDLSPVKGFILDNVYGGGITSKNNKNYVNQPVQCKDIEELDSDPEDPESVTESQYKAAVPAN